MRRPDQLSEAGAIERELASLLGSQGVLAGSTREYLTDATDSRGVHGRADAVALPRSAAEVAKVVAWCYDHDVPMIPRGGGTGFAGGAVPVDGGVVVGLERLRAAPQLDPGQWRARAQAGVSTADLRRRARESGLLFPPDPGAAEQSQLGGNIATNAGGPHAFKYGVTGAWVSGLEAVVAPGELIELGGPLRKDVAGYDIRSLLVGSEGTLGIVTGAWLKLVPAPESALPVAAFFATSSAGCEAIASVLGNGLQVAALEYLDEGALAAARLALPGVAPAGAAFMLLADADGSATEAAGLRGELVDLLEPRAIAIEAPDEPRAVAKLWRWRDGVSLAVTARRGGKVSEDIVVPLERLGEAIDGTRDIGRRHGLEACSWGHAGDGNLHATFLIDPDDTAEIERAARAADELFDMARTLGGSVSGEHGLGIVKSGQLAGQWAPAALDLHERIKRSFDPKGLFNPGKKAAR